MFYKRVYTNLQGNIIFIAHYIVHGVAYMKTNRDVYNAWCVMWPIIG